MHSLVLVEIFHGFFDLFVADFGVFIEGFGETLEVEILDFVGISVNDFLHGFLSEDVSVVISIT